MQMQLGETRDTDGDLKTVFDSFLKKAISWPLFWVRIVNKQIYYMTSYVSGQDEPKLALWFSYRGRQDRALLPARDTGFVPQEKFMICCLIVYNKSFIDQACSVKMAGYWCL